MTPEPQEDTGIVLRVDAKVCHVAFGASTVQLPLAGKLFEARSHEARPVAVGDRVRLTLDATGAPSTIDEVLPRKSKLSRMRAGDDGKEQIIAANVTLVLAVTAVREPGFDASLVDRILAAAEREAIPAAIALTKVDRDQRGAAGTWTDLYSGLGYSVFPTSVREGHETRPTLDSLAQTLHANVTVLCGLSGVGKSSLLNALIPGLDLKTGSIGKLAQGKHTTTSTRLIPLPGGGHVLDTPGIRNFGLFGTGPDELTFYFREMKSLVGQCGYRNCSHLEEQSDCAVARAVASGAIAKSRWDSYRRLRAELDAEER